MLRATLWLPGGDGPGLASALDSLVAVFVMLLEVLEKLTMLVRYFPRLSKLDKHGCEILQSFLMKVVLMGLHVAKLREGLVATIQSAHEGFETLVCFLVGSYIATLSKCLAANTAGVGLLPGVATHVSLQMTLR